MGQFLFNTHLVSALRSTVNFWGSLLQAFSTAVIYVAFGKHLGTMAKLGPFLLCGEGVDDRLRTHLLLVWLEVVIVVVVVVVVESSLWLYLLLVIVVVVESLLQLYL